ncbi:MAG: single-stranded-DNA-specific exonuclease RecJ [candidate division KSB1 bacterium]|nr:single-stranded-DNA-specific exonuclease RecJ [candidate division KSB1 bacterium]
MRAKWTLLDAHSPEEVRRLAQELNVPLPIAKILMNRGIRSYEEAKTFFRPNLSSLHNPFLLSDMDEAVRLLLRAIRERKPVLIYGDYDVDGITGTALLYRFLHRLGVPVFYYIPDRLAEGYGLSERGVREAAARGAKLLLTIDCGVTAAAEVELARQLGMDVIVTDHHEPGDRLPPANAVLDPKKPGCNYPFPDLAGVGVAFKMLQGVVQELRVSADTLYDALDLVAVGTAADIVPLVGENRTLVKIGLERLSDTRVVGLRALLEVSGLKGRQISTGHVVFILAPRINAVGRMGDASRAVELLITPDPNRARQIASVLEAENRQRRSVDEETFREADALVGDECELTRDAVIVLAMEGWHPGVIGIVASRLAERYYRPTVMIAIENGIGRGSARSIPEFDIYSALTQCEHLLLQYGGHRYAAGLLIEEDKIAEFRRRLNEIASSQLNVAALAPSLKIDAELDLDQVDGRFYQLLRLFEPYGPQNMRPVFLSRNLQVVGAPTVVGGNHLKFQVKSKSKVFPAIGFGMGDLIGELPPGRRGLSLVYVIEEDEYQGMRTLHLRVKDFQ